MSYRVPTLAELHALAVAFWKGMFPLSNVGSRFSFHWKRLRAYAGVGTDLHAHINSAQNDVMPDRAQGSFLTRWGKITGTPKKGATGARGANALRVFGTAGSNVLIGDQLTHPPTGFTFQVTENGVVAATGYIDVDVAAISTGSQTRLLKNETLNFNAPGAGIKVQAKLVADLTSDGYDAEQDSAYSRRVNDAIGLPTSGGNADDFVKWALSVLGVSAAYCYANRAGIGTTDVACFHTAQGTARALTDAERAAVLLVLQAKAPSQVGGQNGGLRVLKTAADQQNIEITVVPNGDSAYAFDWEDAGVGIVVLAYNAGTREIQATANLPGSMLAGHRFVSRGVGSAQLGEVYTVDTITAADKFIVREIPSVNFAATDVLYAGGPLTASIRNAIKGHMNGEIVFADDGVPLPAGVADVQKKSTIGLNVLAEPIGPANPAGVYGSWNGDLVREVLASLAMYATGVRKPTVITPAADHAASEGAFPNDDTVNFITPGAILIRKG